MRKERAKIIGCVDTFHPALGFSGWAACTDSPEAEIDLSLHINGVEQDILVQKSNRSDLAHLGAGKHGFEVTTQKELDYQTLITQPFEIIAKLRDSDSLGYNLELGGLLLEQIARCEWSDRLSRLDDNQLNIAIKELAPFIEKSRNIGQNNRTELPPGRLKGTPALLPVGLKSLDEAIIMGEKGHAFLIGGSNNVLANMQDAPSNDDTELALQWVDLFLARNARCSKQNILYAQCVIPEKISVMPEISGLNISTPGGMLKVIENEMSLYSTPYPSMLSTLVKSENPHETFDRIDTHLSASGAFLCFSAIMNALKIELPIKPEFIVPDTPIMGDVSDRFFDAPILCTSEIVAFVPVPLNEDQLKVIDRHEPSGGGHIGTRYVFKNPGAPLPMKAVAFANSFFERGGAPKTLTWWFARAFQEFHFIWSPNFDWSYVDRIKPDIIIGQTIERFLTKLPNA
ncbi:hypothetical protein LWE61_13455 [Sphingobium sufflavum]|uniref:hypothetical protein n=1 Tax=Sphingobium sufflavum TaxID=1129547 RepID=UPI001F217747|nr:hypothetical protein [Sphingobium sufflavum]MCE7797554.1 hypothetical protein [Sphingobium sufflavum]